MLTSSETLLGLSPPQSHYLEAYRRLRTALMVLREQGPFRSLLVTSASPSEGKTSVSLNLGLLAAQTGLRVTIVDGDFAYPAIHERWGMLPAPGLIDACLQKAAVDTILQATELETLKFVATGSMPQEGFDLASGAAMPGVLAAIAERCDLMVIDSAPVLGYASTLQLARMVDAVVLVARARRQVGPVRTALKMLKDIGRDPRGIIVNDILEQDTQTRPRYYSYYGTRGGSRY
jgi:polysaccharide biosynthesis transport protein